MGATVPRLPKAPNRGQALASAWWKRAPNLLPALPPFSSIELSAGSLPLQAPQSGAMPEHHDLRLSPSGLSPGLEIRTMRARGVA